MRFGKLIFILSLFLALTQASAREDDEQFDDLLLKFAVFGPSDEIFIWWGHAALIVENTKDNFSYAYDWGIFSYPSDNFIKDFTKGQVQYKFTRGPNNMYDYIREDRDIIIYTLNLDREAKKTILAYADNRALPENRFYDYHEFRDNCSTGVRDIIDLGTGGQFKAAFGDIPGRLSYRQHTQRYTWFRPMSDWFLGFLMGQNLDRSITLWDEMYLPVELAKNIVDFSYIDSSGKNRKLVSSAEILYVSKDRLPVLNKPLTTWPFFLTAGLFIMVLLFLIDNTRKRYPRLSRIIFNSIQFVFGLLLGVSGCVLLFGLLMDNDYIQQNVNIWFVNPLLLIITPLSVFAAINKPVLIKCRDLLRFIWAYIFIAGNVTQLLGILPFFFQRNQSVCALILPIAFAFSNIPEIARGLKSTLNRPSKTRA